MSVCTVLLCSAALWWGGGSGEESQQSGCPSNGCPLLTPPCGCALPPPSRTPPHPIPQPPQDPPIPSHSPTRSPSPSLHTDHPQIRSVSVLGGALGAPTASSGSRGDSGCHSVPMGGVWLCALPPLGCETLGAVCPIPLRTPPLPHLGPPPTLLIPLGSGGAECPSFPAVFVWGRQHYGDMGGGREEMGRVQTGLGRILCFERNPEHLPHPSPRGGPPSVSP